MKNKPLTILFDANPIVNSGKSGVGYYTIYLVQSLAKAYPDKVRLIGHYYNFLGRKHPADLPTGPNISYRQTRLFPGKVTNLLRRLGINLPFEILTKARGNLIIFPNFFSLPSLFRTPIITTIHDLCYLVYPEFVSARNQVALEKYVPDSIRRSSLLLAVSGFTKQSLIKSYGVQPSKILVTPVPPIETSIVKPSGSAASLVRGMGVGEHFIFFVGNLEPRKNLERLVEAYLALDAELRNKYSLVLAGGKGWNNDGLMAKIKSAQKDGFKIVLPGYITDKQKDALYQQADLVVLPSLYEGFGMPVMEAYRYNAVVAVSDIPVLREVAGEAAFYFDPKNTDSITRTLSRALTDNKTRQHIRTSGAARLSQYSWQHNAENLFNEFREILR